MTGIPITSGRICFPGSAGAKEAAEAERGDDGKPGADAGNAGKTDSDKGRFFRRGPVCVRILRAAGELRILENAVRDRTAIDKRFR